MKKNIFRRFLTAATTETTHGESYGSIIKLFWPEFVSSLLLYSLPLLIDSFFVASLRSTSMYATSGLTNALMHLLIKAAEAFSVVAVIMVGQHNGAGDYQGAGRVFRGTFWASCVFGFSLSGMLYLGARSMYTLSGVPLDMQEYGIRYLQIRAIGIGCMFVYQACIGFLRGIKNTRVPMLSFIGSSILFVCVDYMLIFGKFGLPAMGLSGSAVASVIQYLAATAGVIAYILSSRSMRVYAIKLLSKPIDLHLSKRLFSLSWPVMLDKTLLAAAYMWLSVRMGSVGTNASASYRVVRDMESFAFLPAIAFAQVITFLVSNDMGKNNWLGIKSNLIKILYLASAFMYVILIALTVYARQILDLFDQAGNFAEFAIFVFPLVSLCTIFDLIQVLTAGALRGASAVRSVMFVRLCACLLFIGPMIYFMSRLPIRDDIRFILIYSSFYIGNIFMCLGYWYQFKRRKRLQQVGDA